MIEDACNAVLIAREDLTEELSILRIRPDSGVVPEFLPGQFIKLGLPRAEAADVSESAETAPLSDSRQSGGLPDTLASPAAAVHLARRPRSAPRLIRRAYSIASSARQRDHVEVFVARIERGKLTPRLWDVDRGGRVWMDDKVAGAFTLASIPPGKNLVMVATGTGVAPFVSMIRTRRNDPPWRRVILINGVRYARDLGYRAELEGIARSDPRLVYVPIASREPENGGWAGLRGRVQQVLDSRMFNDLVGSMLAPNECHVMLCGNPAMITKVSALLEQRGFRTHSAHSPGNLHYERYW